MNSASRIRTPAVQRMLEAMNPDFMGNTAPDLPDSDANIEHLDFVSFDIPGCTRCGGVVKPDVVFFGESVPRELVQDAARSNPPMPCLCSVHR